MSEDNVELAKRAVAAAFTEPPDLETLSEISTPALVLTTNWGVDQTEHHGMQGFVDAIAEMTAAFDPWEQEPERFVDAGQDRVVVLMHLTAQGKGSGVPVEFRWAMVLTVSGGEIAAVRAFIDQAEALEAAGVVE
jgi:ketosteroid isomerase-like protein